MCPQVPEDAHQALVDELRGRLAEAGVWLAGGLPQDRVLAGALLNQAAAITGAQLLGGSDELLDASVDEARDCDCVKPAGFELRDNMPLSV